MAWAEVVVCEGVDLERPFGDGQGTRNAPYVCVYQGEDQTFVR
jgi:hypothetical protein